jgi:hypothetical protein
MANANCTEQECPVRAADGAFFVTATQPIQTPSRLISPGVHIMIDPAKRAVDGSMVLRGNSVERWDGGNYQGVVVALYEEEYSEQN